MLRDRFSSGRLADTRRRACILPSIEQIPRAACERMLPGENEDWDFYRTAEKTPPSGFSLAAIAVFDGNEVVAAAPVFRINYRLDTPFQGRARRVGDWIYNRWPRLVSRSMIGIGSPMSDSSTIGFAPELSPRQRQDIFAELLTSLHAEARAQDCAVLAVKSLGRQSDFLHTPLIEQGYHRVTNLPIVPSQDAASSEVTDRIPHFGRRTRDIVFALFENTMAQSKGRYGRDVQSSVRRNSL
jgi:hypothetical protein